MLTSLVGTGRPWRLLCQWRRRRTIAMVQTTRCPQHLGMRFSSAIKKLKSKSAGSDRLTGDQSLHDGVGEAYRWNASADRTNLGAAKTTGGFEAGCHSYRLQKGDRMECLNFRAITVFNVIYQMLSQMMLSRLASLGTNIVGTYNDGFVY